jgi:hypothetical protein
LYIKLNPKKRFLVVFCFSYIVTNKNRYVRMNIVKENMNIYTSLSGMGILPLISTSYIFSIDELTLILKLIGLCDVKYMYITMLPIKTITSDFKVSTYIITSIAVIPTRLGCNTIINVCLDLQNRGYSIYKHDQYQVSPLKFVLNTALCY